MEVIMPVHGNKLTTKALMDYIDIYTEFTALCNIKSGHLSNTEKKKLLELINEKLTQLNDKKAIKFTDDQIALIEKLTHKKGGLKKASNKLINKLQNLFSNMKGSKAISNKQTELQTEANQTIQKQYYDLHYNEYMERFRLIDVVFVKPLIDLKIISSASDLPPELYTTQPTKKYLVLADKKRAMLEKIRDGKETKDLAEIKSLVEGYDANKRKAHLAILKALEPKIVAREAELKQSIADLENDIKDKKAKINEFCELLKEFFKKHNLPEPQHFDTLGYRSYTQNGEFWSKFIDEKLDLDKNPKLKPSDFYLQAQKIFQQEKELEPYRKQISNTESEIKNIEWDLKKLDIQLKIKEK